MMVVQTAKPLARRKEGCHTACSFPFSAESQNTGSQIYRGNHYTVLLDRIDSLNMTILLDLKLSSIIFWPL